MTLTNKLKLNIITRPDIAIIYESFNVIVSLRNGKKYSKINKYILMLIYKRKIYIIHEFKFY